MSEFVTVEVTTRLQWDKSVLASPSPIAVVFYAMSSSPSLEYCRELRKFHDEQNPPYSIAFIDVYGQEQLANNMRVSIVPTTMVFCSNQKLDEKITRLTVSEFQALMGNHMTEV